MLNLSVLLLYFNVLTMLTCGFETSHHGFIRYMLPILPSLIVFSFTRAALKDSKQFEKS